MALADWTELTGVIAAPSLARGVTAGNTPPNGGGTFVYGMNTLAVVTGAYGRFTDLANFAPMSEGAIIASALKRGTGGGNTGWDAFLFLGLGGPDVSDLGYKLGLSDADPARITLAKGSVSAGLPDDVPGSSGVLARSTATFAVDSWVHLRLEMVVNTSGDVVLNAYQNDLAANSVSSPVWVAIDGMKDFVGGVEATAFIDDALQVNSGSAPLTSGRGGYAGSFSDTSRRSFFDHITLARQL